MSRPTQVARMQTPPFNLRGSHPLWRAFPDASDTEMFSPNCTGTCTYPHLAPTTPPRSNGVHLGTAPVWAPPRSLAATWGISIDFFSSGYLDGSVPQVYRSWHYVFTPWHTSFGRMGYPIRSPAHHRIFAPTRGFSQLVTTFFVRQLQGIRRGPFLT